MSADQSLYKYLFSPRVVASGQILTRSFCSMVFHLRAFLNPTYTTLALRTADCRPFLSSVPGTPEGCALCGVNYCRIKTKKLLSGTQILLLQAHVLAVRSCMETHLWIDELVCSTHTSAIRRICSSFTFIL